MPADTEREEVAGSLELVVVVREKRTTELEAGSSCLCGRELRFGEPSGLLSVFLDLRAARGTLVFPTRPPAEASPLLIRLS